VPIIGRFAIGIQDALHRLAVLEFEFDTIAENLRQHGQAGFGRLGTGQGTFQPAVDDRLACDAESRITFGAIPQLAFRFVLCCARAASNSSFVLPLLNLPPSKSAMIV
jgi:hypothetical protein